MDDSATAPEGVAQLLAEIAETLGDDLDRVETDLVSALSGLPAGDAVRYLEEGLPEILETRLGLSGDDVAEWQRLLPSHPPLRMADMVRATAICVLMEAADQL